MSDETNIENVEEVQEENTGLRVGIAMHPITNEPVVVLVVNRNGESQNIVMPPDEAYNIGNSLNLNAMLVFSMKQTAGIIQQSIAQQAAPKIHLPH